MPGKHEEGMIASVHMNILLVGLNRRIGEQLVLKRIRGEQTILCREPTFPENQVFSPAPREHQERFYQTPRVPWPPRPNPCRAIARDPGEFGGGQIRREP